MPVCVFLYLLHSEVHMFFLQSEVLTTSKKVWRLTLGFRVKITIRVRVMVRVRPLVVMDGVRVSVRS